MEEIQAKFERGEIQKAEFIQLMHEKRHAIFFEYANYIAQTNIRKIEIEDGRVIMTSRDKGVRIECAPNDFRIAPIETLNFFDYEKYESKMIENLVGENDNFFDIGANIGWYALNISFARRNSHIYCFEPIPNTFHQLGRNLDLNPSRNIQAYNFGFSKQAGEFTFYYYPEGSGNASAANVTGRDDVEKIQCQLETLDAFTKKNPIKVDFIKCDVEGAELHVFQGGVETIKRERPIIFSEILRKWSRKFEYDPNEIFNLLRGIGYLAFTVNKDYLSEFQFMSERTIETNFFFLHAEKHKELILKWSETHT